MGDGRRLGFRDALNRFVRTHSFVSQIAAFTGPALVPDFVSCRSLPSYLPDTSPVERLDLGTEVELIRLRHQMTFTGSLSLSADVGEVRSFYGEGKGGRQGPGPGAPVQHHRDGAFILPLLQSGVWMFLFVTRVCAVLAGRAALSDLVM